METIKYLFILTTHDSLLSSLEVEQFVCAHERDIYGEMCLKIARKE